MRPQLLDRFGLLQADVEAFAMMWKIAGYIIGAALAVIGWVVIVVALVVIVAAWVTRDPETEVLPGRDDLELALRAGLCLQPELVAGLSAGIRFEIDRKRLDSAAIVPAIAGWSAFAMK